MQIETPTTPEEPAAAIAARAQAKVAAYLRQKQAEYEARAASPAVA